MQALSIEKITSHTGKKISVETAGVYMMSILYNHLEILFEDNKFKFSKYRVAEKLEKDGHGDFVSSLDNVDVVTVQTIYLMQLWKYRGFKNYIPSNPLIDVLKEIDTSMPCSQFKEGMEGYIELSHTSIEAPLKWRESGGNGFAFLLYKVLEEGGKTYLVISFTLKDYSNSSSFFVPLENSNEDIRDTLQKFTYSVPRKVNGEVVVEQLPLDKEDLKILTLGLNLIIYVSNPNEEFKKVFNDLKPLRKSKHKEYIDYTSKSYIPIGFDAEFLRLTKEGSFDVRGHWRWAAVGVGRLLRRLTFVRPHSRTLKSKI